MTGLTATRPKLSKVAQVLALGIAVISSLCSYFFPKYVTTLAPYFSLVVGSGFLIIVASLLISRKTPSRSLQSSPLTQNHVVCAVSSNGINDTHAWWLVIVLVPLLLHGVLSAIAIFHFPVFARQIAAPAGTAMGVVFCYWLLVVMCVGIVRFFQQHYPHYFLYEAFFSPISKGIWHRRIVDYGLYLLLMSQVIFYGLCISGVFLFILRILQRENIEVLNIDAWYFSLLFVGVVVLLTRKLPLRKALRQGTRWRWSINHWLVLFGMTVLLLLNTPTALSHWLIAQGIYTELHHYYLVQTLVTLKENLGATTVRGWYLAGSLWLLTIPWMTSLYCRFAGRRSFGFIAMTICVSALFWEGMVFTQLDWLVSQVFSLKMASIACIFLLIYIGLTFRKQTNNHRLLGGWLPAYPESLSIKPRSCADGLGRLLRLSVMLFLLSVAGLWPIIQLQISLYAFGLLLMWGVIILSYIKYRLRSIPNYRSGCFTNTVFFKSLLLK
jgi:hypothetical protein